MSSVATEEMSSVATEEMSLLISEYPLACNLVAHAYRLTRALESCGAQW